MMRSNLTSKLKYPSLRLIASTLGISSDLISWCHLEVLFGVLGERTGKRMRPFIIFVRVFTFLSGPWKRWACGKKSALLSTRIIRLRPRKKICCSQSLEWGGGGTSSAQLLVNKIWHLLALLQLWYHGRNLQGCEKFDMSTYVTDNLQQSNT